MSLLRRAIALRTGGGTERCHGIRHHSSYPVSAHSWGVAMLMLQLWPEHFARLVVYCLVHDIPEAWIGDIPAPTKKFSTSVKAACDTMERVLCARLDIPCDADLSKEDAARLKACDHLELYLWAREQVHGGNGHAACVVRELESYFEESPLLEPAHALYVEARTGSVEHATDNVIREILQDGSVAQS